MPQRMKKQITVTKVFGIFGPVTLRIASSPRKDKKAITS
jgi:hypothetical protein